MRSWSPASRFRIAAFVVIAAACGSESGPDLSGSWSGQLVGSCGPVLSLEITESDRDVLSGSATVMAPVSCGFSAAVNYGVSGEHDHPDVVATLTPIPGQGVTANAGLRGVVRDADAIDATLNGTAVVLVRQTSP